MFTWLVACKNRNNFANTQLLNSATCWSYPSRCITNLTRPEPTTANQFCGQQHQQVAKQANKSSRQDHNRSQSHLRDKHATWQVSRSSRRTDLCDETLPKKRKLRGFQADRPVGQLDLPVCLPPPPIRATMTCKAICCACRRRSG